MFLAMPTVTHTVTGFIAPTVNVYTVAPVKMLPALFTAKPHPELDVRFVVVADTAEESEESGSGTDAACSDESSSEDSCDSSSSSDIAADYAGDGKGHLWLITIELCPSGSSGTLTRALKF